MTYCVISKFMGGESGPRAIDSSNLGFQLLKKCGWKEGTGLGVAEQGRLEPVEAYARKNKRGLGAEKIKQSTVHGLKDPSPAERVQKEHLKLSKKSKFSSKRMRKMEEEEKRAQETAFARDFFREFWPDNV